MSPLDDGALSQLRGDLSGDVLGDGDSGYEDARAIFNSMITKRPAAIAQVQSAEDVSAALGFARDKGLEVSIRSGGHSVAGSSLTDGGVEIDMRGMNTVTVDAEARTATAGGGALWQHFDAACQPHGLAATGGRISTTGVAGLSLGGGSGWLERKFGLAADNIVSAEMVTAAGRIVRASEDENPELFWALHGAGGNFGVATELVFRLHPLPEFSVALMFWPPDAGPEVTRAYRDFAESAPDEIGGGTIFLTAPPAPFVPEHMQGTLVSAVLTTFAGSESGLRELIAPLLALEPEGQMVAEMPYMGLQSMLDDPPGMRNYWSAEYVSELPDEALDIYCEHASGFVVPSATQHVLFPWGGAVARGGADSPLATRDAPWAVHPLGIWEDPADDEKMIAWARGVIADFKPYSTGATYLNFVGDEGDDRIVSAYGRENYDRLAAVKAEFDPENVFHLNQPIRPLATA